MKYYYCYSYPQKEFLKNNGFNYISAGTNLTTNKRYWLFESSDRLNEFLQVWRDNKYL